LKIELKEISKYKHQTYERVKFHEVDLMNVCNNAVYFNYFEDARIKYVLDLKKDYNLKELLENDSFFIMVHNECDYYEPALFDDELIILTRIDFIKNTSFGFRHLVLRKNDKNIIAGGSGIVVHINLKTKIKIPLPAEFYDAVADYEDKVSLINK
jgi:acyl-CoA thioester hydrolase